MQKLPNSNLQDLDQNSNSTLAQILDVFWQIHDPTKLNKQGADIGSQYASVIFWQNIEQLKIINQSLDKLKDSGKYLSQIVTKIEQKINLKTNFWKAEEKHQDYFVKNPSTSYCQMVVLPKIEKTKKFLEPLETK